MFFFNLTLSCTLVLCTRGPSCAVVVIRQVKIKRFTYFLITLFLQDRANALHSICDFPALGLIFLVFYHVVVVLSPYG